MPTQPLTPAEYRAAIYLDFEGEGKKRDGTIPMPHMAGLFRPNQTGTNGQYSCVFFSTLWRVVRNHFFKKAVIADFADWFEQLALEVQTSGQHIVYWSIHEEVVVRKYLTPHTLNMIAPKLHNLDYEVLVQSCLKYVELDICELPLPHESTSRLYAGLKFAPLEQVVQTNLQSLL